MKTFEEHVKLSKRAKEEKLEFLNRIRLTTSESPVNSKQVERVLRLKGSELRQLVKVLRREGYPIASCGKGYYYARNIEEIMPTLDHMKMRRDSIALTINKMMEGKLFTEDQQSLL